MSHRLLSVGVRNRHPSRLVPSVNDSFPIPVWEAGAIVAEVSEIEKLKQLCGLKQTELHQSFLPGSDHPAIRPFIQWMSFLGIGISLCLSAHTSSDSTLNNLSSLTSRIPDASQVNEVHEIPDLSQLNSQANPSAALAKASVGSTEILQKGSGAGGFDRTTLTFTKPVTGFPLTSAFGSRVHPIFGDTRFHEGIDLGTPNGTPVKAAREGVVTFADWDGGYGKKIIIRHEAGYETLYAHLDELLVSAGDQVAQEEVIGLSGSTGYVTGPHLHFEIRVNQVAHNPLDYL